ncbi:MAG: putative RNA-binding protein (virulence factor B family) [Alphaproteobacteria bacterium]|jgi:predicted RNA-binding protein (virulence factor B family)
MLKIGQFNRLYVVEIFPFGYELLGHGMSQDQVVMLKDTSQVYTEGQELDVFVYTHADGSFLGAIDAPKVMLHQFSPLVVVGASTHGCFFDWGIKPDLYAPEGQLHTDLDIGSRYVVCAVLDKIGKLVATTKIERFLGQHSHQLSTNESVSLLIYAQTPLGYKAIVNDEFQGLLFNSELITSVKIGDYIDGFVKSVREDGKLDLSLQAQTSQARLSLSEEILEDLIAHDGMSTLTDKSSPDEIFARFKVSKAAYKRAIGSLYKLKQIRIEKNCLYINQETD